MLRLTNYYVMQRRHKGEDMFRNTFGILIAVIMLALTLAPTGLSAIRAPHRHHQKQAGCLIYWDRSTCRFSGNLGAGGIPHRVAL